jgi:hypothetical protein
MKYLFMLWSLLLFSCSQPERNNPWDPNGDSTVQYIWSYEISQVGDSFLTKSKLATGGRLFFNEGDVGQNWYCGDDTPILVARMSCFLDDGELELNARASVDLLDREEQYSTLHFLLKPDTNDLELPVMDLSSFDKINICYQSDAHLKLALVDAPHIINGDQNYGMLELPSGDFRGECRQYYLSDFAEGNGISEMPVGNMDFTTAVRFELILPYENIFSSANTLVEAANLRKSFFRLRSFDLEK